MRDPRTDGSGPDDGAAEFGGNGFGFTTAYCPDCDSIEYTVWLFGDDTDHEIRLSLTVAQALELQDLLRRATNDAIETTTNRNEMEF
ncbi:hypothetical protein [Nocardia tengchongensis]